MADNVLLNAGTGGDTVRTVDKSGIETQTVILDLGGSGTESLWARPVTALSPATASITTADSTPVAANATRKGLIVTNIGSATVFFGIGATAVLNSGIVLTPGGTWVMDHFTYNVAAIHALSASSSTLAIQEFN